MTEFLKALFAKAIGSDFLNALAGRFYLDTVPQGVEYPHAVAVIVTNNPEYNFKSTVEDTTLQISILSVAEGAAEISGIYENLKSLYDDCPLTVTGSNFIWMVRQGLQTMTENAETVTGTPIIRHWAVDYNIKAEK